jgi:hypothetical protein
MDSADKFSQEDIAPALEIWAKDFNGETVTETEMEYSNLVFAAQRYTYNHAGVWPTLAELEEWTEVNAEKSDQVTTWPTHAEEQKTKK